MLPTNNSLGLLTANQELFVGATGKGTPVSEDGHQKTKNFLWRSLRQTFPRVGKFGLLTAHITTNCILYYPRLWVIWRPSSGRRDKSNLFFFEKKNVFFLHFFPKSTILRICGLTLSEKRVILGSARTH